MQELLLSLLDFHEVHMNPLLKLVKVVLGDIPSCKDINCIYSACYHLQYSPPLIYIAVVFPSIQQQSTAFRRKCRSKKHKCNSEVRNWERTVSLSTGFQSRLDISKPRQDIQQSKAYIRVLVLARRGIIFPVADKGHGQDPQVILYQLTSLSGVGETFFQEEGVLVWSSNHSERSNLFY